VVKHFMRGQGSQPVNRRNLPPLEVAPSRLNALGKRFAGPGELAANPRSRSAVLRVAEKRS
jgi:16S rRNA (cytosine1402-N4)-methyltransferase